MKSAVSREAISCCLARDREKRSERKQGPQRSQGEKGAEEQPRYLKHVPLRVEKTVKLAGATSYRVPLPTCFSCCNQRTAFSQVRTTGLRANVGFSRAISSAVIVSPLDMRGLVGTSQALGTTQGGLELVFTNTY